ncbi:MAG: hypothetical protein DRQ10_03240 [Candidatus Hydrothermota bacterium]|nr:MAG: hypothetical protein DRQ10_03240 [Candidatus Hydrothermae bacterium]
MKLPLLLFLITVTPKEAYDALRANTSWSSIRFEAEMVIQRGKRKVTKRFYGVGTSDKFFVEFTNPEDYGTRILKLQNRLYIYLPDIDDVVRISGDMMRQSLMGSDLSYEDLMNEDPWKLYAPTSLKDTSFESQRVYLLELRDTSGRATYASIKLWLLPKKFVPLKAEYIARGGRVVKTVEVIEYKSVDSKLFPIFYIMRDLRRRNSKTTVKIHSVKIDIPLDSDYFRRERLYR